jgi:hypothetical protein
LHQYHKEDFFMVNSNPKFAEAKNAAAEIAALTERVNHLLGDTSESVLILIPMNFAIVGLLDYIERLEAKAAQAPEVAEVQAPEVAEAQTPEATEVQAPEATEAQAPEATEAQAPEATEVQAPEATEAQALEPAKRKPAKRKPAKRKPTKS